MFSRFHWLHHDGDEGVGLRWVSKLSEDVMPARSLSGTGQKTSIHGGDSDSFKTGFWRAWPWVLHGVTAHLYRVNLR